MTEFCPVCNGNNGDMPCAYPSEGMKGCLRDKTCNRCQSEMTRVTGTGKTGYVCLKCLKGSD